MVYGTSLHLPGQFLDQTLLSTQPTSQYVQKLIKCMSDLKMTPPKHHDTPPVYVDRHLKTCSHVFVRVDSHRSALQPRYSGPHKVLQRHEKYFIMALDGKLPKVSIDRLKAAHLPNQTHTSNIDNNITLNCTDNIQSTREAGNNSSSDTTNEFSDEEADVVYQYQQLLQQPTTRYGRIIRRPTRFQQ